MNIFLKQTGLRLRFPLNDNYLEVFNKEVNTYILKFDYLKYTVYTECIEDAVIIGTYDRVANVVFNENIIFVNYLFEQLKKIE